MKYYLIIIITITLSFGGYSQNEDLSMLSYIPKQENNPQGTPSTNKETFVAKYELEKKKPIMAIVTSSFESHTEPNCSSAGTNIIIPKDSIVYLYKFIPKDNCWAINYKGNWGFLPNSKVFPINKRSQNKLKGSKFDAPPQLRTHISPKYPKGVREAGIRGKVFFKVFIDKNGKPIKTTILKGPKELEEATIKAVEKAKFKPAKLDGKKVGVWVTLSLNYN